MSARRKFAQPALKKGRDAVREFGRTAKVDFSQPHVVAVSGGADSLALAGICASLKLPSTAIIVDHQLQAQSSQVAERACQQVRELGLAARVVPVTVTGRHEAAARRARYQALVAPGLPVLVAHTQNDAAETLLLRGLRGQAGGMLAVTQYQQVPILRPLLRRLRREDTESICQELGLDFWEDPTNPQVLRGKIRHQTIPQLGQWLGSSAVGPLAAAAAAAAADRQAVSTWASRLLADVDLSAGLPLVLLEAQPAALITEILVQFLQAHDVVVNQNVLLAAQKIVFGLSGAASTMVKTKQSGTIMVVRDRTHLKVRAET